MQFFTQSARAEILLEMDEAEIKEGSLANQDGWMELPRTDGESQGTVDVQAGAIVLQGGAGAWVQKPLPVSSPEVFYGFDLTVQKAPLGGGKTIASLAAGDYRRGGLIIASPSTASATFGLRVSSTAGGMPVEFPFSAEQKYRVVVGARSGEVPRLWISEEDLQEEKPYMEGEDGPLRGPFNGFGFAPVAGQVTIANLTVATTFDEAKKGK